jgi:hypothetical protein
MSTAGRLALETLNLETIARQADEIKTLQARLAEAEKLLKECRGKRHATFVIDGDVDAYFAKGKP